MNKEIFRQQILAISETLKTIRDNGRSITPDFVRKVVIKTITEIKEYAPLFEASESDIEALIFEISNVFSVKVDDELIVLADPTIQKWLDSSKKDIPWNHWNAYENMLKKQARSEETIKANEDVIDAVLDYSGDPRKKGTWARKGLVMGNVQSGKTQNYIGLINKAIDAGYKTIILLGGHLNDLRKQTQERVDEGILGRESRHIIEFNKEKNVPIGVGEFGINNVNSGTTTMGDFSKSFADKLNFSLTGADPVIFTIKKHSGLMKRLFEWINAHHFLDVKNGIKLEGPLLLIDDEADYATVNTKHHKDEITSTNEGIRNLLSLFQRSSYIGYTATPFANIFIDPDENSYSDEDDLFPKDFMVKIPVPNNYLGQNFYFSGSSNAIVPLEENNSLYELKKTDEINGIPDSLKKAIRGFVLVCAIRALRGDSTAHNSMLVNVSHLKIHQNKLEYYIKGYFDDLNKAYNSYRGLGVIGARSNSILKDIEDTFYSLFNCEEEYFDVFELLNSAFDKIKVWAVNQSNGANEKVLDYSKSRDKGLNVIVIGGHKLSRGLTLEGLSISYFTRNSKAYDTLMQMCRWFGYRPKYDDLCKLFISNESEYWYSFIAEAIEELYFELGIMRDRELTPKEFGLKVREHPGAMIVTAKNKMGASISETRTQDLWGQILRRFRFKSDRKSNDLNLKYAEEFINRLSADPTKQNHCNGYSDENDKASASHIYADVDYEDVIAFIEKIDLPEDDVGNNALIHQLKGMMKETAIPKFKVALYNQRTIGKTTWEHDIKDLHEISFINEKYRFAGKSIVMPKRLLNTNGKYYSKPSTNLGNSDDEKIFLTESARKEIKGKKQNAASYDYIASPERDYPTLIIYLFAVAIKDFENSSSDKDVFKLGHGLRATLGYTIAIPRPEYLKDKTQAEVKALVKNTKYSYQLNKIAQRLNVVEEYSNE
ncbi:Putative endonuclease, Z1 domain protein [Glaciecola sp. 4H-3-7+YE-5]|nr:Putative endonuclease, Z1 domain protein [Glaciecola sp. 4H-3-7+YE-5]